MTKKEEREINRDKAVRCMANAILAVCGYSHLIKPVLEDNIAAARQDFKAVEPGQLKEDNNRE
jgi:hypothetical protein